MTLSLEKIEVLIAQWTFDKKARLLNFLAQDLNRTYPGIEKTPNVCGGRACIIRTRIPVWTLVSYKKLGLSDAGLLDAYQVCGNKIYTMLRLITKPIKKKLTTTSKKTMKIKINHYGKTISVMLLT